MLQDDRRCNGKTDENDAELDKVGNLIRDHAAEGRVEDGDEAGQQQADGGFATGGAANAESCAQVVVALESLGLPLTDSRFVKNGATVLNALLSYQLSDGSFCHVKDGGSNLMATEQSLYALAAVKRAEQGESGLYVMEGLETASRNTSEVGTLIVGWSAWTIAAVALTAAFASPK